MAAIVLVGHVLLWLAWQRGAKVSPRPEPGTVAVYRITVVPLAPASGGDRHALAAASTPAPALPRPQPVRRASPAPTARMTELPRVPDDAPTVLRGGDPAGERQALDYEGMKKSARGIASEGRVQNAPGADRGMTANERLHSAIGRASRPDCANRHADKGLLAIPFLLAEAASDTGCKW